MSLYVCLIENNLHMFTCIYVGLSTRMRFKMRIESKSGEADSKKMLYIINYLLLMNYIDLKLCVAGIAMAGS